MSLKETGFCWKCGHAIGEMIDGRLVFGVSKKLFCNPKHQKQYEREQERQIKKGKKAGYGLAGSTH
jgi:hypothetical protein